MTAVKQARPKSEKQLLDVPKTVKRRKPKEVDIYDIFKKEFAYLDNLERYSVRTPEEKAMFTDNPNFVLLHTEFYEPEFLDMEFMEAKVFGLKSDKGHFPFFILGLDDYMYRTQQFNEVQKILDAQNAVLESIDGVASCHRKSKFDAAMS